MADATPVPAAAALAGIKQREEWASSRYAEAPELRDSLADVPRLLAAVEAVLKAAASARSVDDVYDVESDSYRPVAWNLDPAKIREAITAALAGTGKEGSEDG